MERQEVLDEVASSDPRDWEFIEMGHESHRVFVYSRDVDLRIEDRHLNGVEDEGWETEWSEGLTGNTVRKGLYYVYYGDIEDVRHAVSRNYRSESIVGPESEHYERKRDDLQKFKSKEGNPNVLKWVNEEIAILTDRIKSAKVAEESTGWYG